MLNLLLFIVKLFLLLVRQQLQLIFNAKEKGQNLVEYLRFQLCDRKLRSQRVRTRLLAQDGDVNV